MLFNMFKKHKKPEVKAKNRNDHTPPYEPNKYPPSRLATESAVKNQVDE